MNRRTALAMMVLGSVIARKRCDAQAASPSTSQAPTTVERVRLLPPDSEAVLALQAGPPSVAARAAVYVLGEKGYIKYREGTNGFSCYVQHNHPQDFIPRCDDAAGTAYLLPVYMRREELRAAGKTTAEIRLDLAEGFRSGKFRPPPAAGVAYMLGETCFYDGGRNACGGVIEPYMMIFAPFKTLTDLGFTDEQGRATAPPRGLPSLSDPGNPIDYLLVPLPGWKRPYASSRP